MTDLDKMARELMAAEHEADDPASMTAERLRSGLPVMWWADDLALRAIRAALLTEPPGYVLVPVEPTPEMWTAAGECGLPYPSWGDYYRAMLAARPEVKL